MIRFPQSFGRTAALIPALALATGCTELRTRTALPDKEGIAPAGLLYHLPAKVLDIKFDFEFSACAVGSDGIPQLSYTLTPAVTERLIADPEKAYVIDYEALDGLTKATNLDIKLFDNATLKSVNLTQDDRTGQIMLDVVKTGFNIASSVVTGGMVGGGVPNDPKAAVKRAKALEDNACSDLKAKLSTLADAKQNFKAAKAHDEQLDEAKAEIDTAQAAVDAAKAAVAAAKADKDDDAATEAGTKLHKARADLKAAQAAAKTLGNPQAPAAAKILAAATAAVTRGFTVSWQPTRPGKPVNFVEEPFTLPPSALAGIIDLDALQTSLPINVAAVISVPNPAASGTVDEKGGDGIVYRQPLQTRLVICDLGRSAQCLNNDKISVGTGALRLDTMITMPQFGIIATMPLHNGAFADNALVLGLSETGAVTSLGFKSAARAERAAAAARDASSSALGQITSLTKLIAERKAAGRQEQLDSQDFIKKLADAQRAAELAKAGVVDQSAAQTQAAEQKLKEIEAQIKLIDAQSRLDAAKAASGSQP